MEESKQNYKLYKVSGRGHDYAFCEYACPTLQSKIDIEIPDDFIDNEMIEDQEDLDILFEMGLIDKLLYQDICDGNMEQTVYFVAKEVGEDEWICCRLKHIDNRLVGRLPVKFDKYKHTVIWTVYAILYFLFLYWLIGEIFKF